MLQTFSCSSFTNKINNKDSDSIIVNLDSISKKANDIEYRIYPVNDISIDSSLTCFIKTLQKACINCDADLLVSLLNDKIVSNNEYLYNYETENLTDIDRFKAIWKLNSGASEVYSIILKLIDLGGVFYPNDSEKNNAFYLPYPFWKWINKKGYDGNRLAVCIKKEVNLYSKPDTSSVIIEKLNYDELNIIDTTTEYNNINPLLCTKIEDNNWLFVVCYNSGLKGYVMKKDIYLSVDFRMIIKKKNSEWKISLLGNCF